MSFGIRRELDMSYDAAIAKVPEALKTQGFGVLTEIDIKDTLKKKIDVDFRRYKIFGACNPPLAHQALTTELEIGIMLPCNVVVYEADGGKAVAIAVDPMKTIAAAGKSDLAPLAATVKEKLERALAAI